VARRAGGGAIIGHVGISVERTDDARVVLGRAGAFLETRPVEHNLLVSLLRLRARSREPGRYWMAVDADAVVGVGFQSPLEFPLTITPMPGDAVEAIVDAIAGAGVALPGVSGVAGPVARFAGAWVERTKAPARPVNAQRIYELDELSVPDGVPGQPRQAAQADRPLVVSWMRAFERELAELVLPLSEAAIDRRLEAGQLWLWDDGGAASLAGHTEPVAGVARVGPVYTPADRRNRGYASALVGALSRRLVGGGNRCILYADLANPVSNSVYRRLGYRPVAEVLWYRFG
jgi:GNAT superfamily N-acetyltransferase